MVYHIFITMTASYILYNKYAVWLLLVDLFVLQSFKSVLLKYLC